MLVVEVYGGCWPVSVGGVCTYAFGIKYGDRGLASGSGVACVGGGCNIVLAEYQGLIKALEWLVDNGYRDEPLIVRTTNILMAYQLEGVIRVTRPYEEAYRRASELLNLFYPSIEVVDRVLLEAMAVDEYVRYMDKHPEVVARYREYLVGEEEVEKLRGLGLKPHRYLSRYEYEELLSQAGAQAPG